MNKVWGALAVMAVLGGCVSNQNKPEDVAYCARDAGLPQGATVSAKNFENGTITRFNPPAGATAVQMERANMCLAMRSSDRTVRDLALRGYPTGVHDCRVKYGRTTVPVATGLGIGGVLISAAVGGIAHGMELARIDRCLAPYGTTRAEIMGSGPYRGRAVATARPRSSVPVAKTAPTSSCTGSSVFSGGAGYCGR